MEETIKIKQEECRKIGYQKSALKQLTLKSLVENSVNQMQTGEDTPAAQELRIRAVQELRRIIRRRAKTLRKCPHKNPHHIMRRIENE